jgi:hypothetical protein
MDCAHSDKAMEITQGWGSVWYNNVMSNRATILESVIGHPKGQMSPELARYLLSLDFPPSAQTRYAELTERAQAGSLTDEERAELEDFLNVNDFLTIVQSKARVALGGNSSAA